MDYLEAKVEKLEKEQKNHEADANKLNRKIESLQEKMQLLRSDRDDKDKINKKLKAMNEDLKNKLLDLEIKNEQMFIKIE